MELLLLREAALVLFEKILETLVIKTPKETNFIDYDVSIAFIAPLLIFFIKFGIYL
jgi:hypothetical protein